MNKQFWLRFFAYLVPTFPLGYFWHLVWFHDAYDRLGLYRPDVMIPMGLSSMIIQAVLFSWGFPKLFVVGKASWMRHAILSFVVFGLLAWSYTVLPVAAKFRMTSVADFVWLETGFTFLQFAVVAPLLALTSRSK